MIAEAIRRQVARSPQAIAVIAGDTCVSYRHIQARAFTLAEQLRPLQGRSVAIDASRCEDLIVALAAADEAGLSAVVLSPAAKVGAANLTQSMPKTAATLQAVENQIEVKCDKLLEHDLALGRSDDVILFTSGTSGQPKPVVHSWASLTKAVRRSDRFLQRRWLGAYEPSSFAGLQVLLQSLLTSGTLIAPASSSPPEIARSLHRHRVEFACGTPTFWRNVLAAIEPEELCENCLTQLTLGGEPADQELLAALRRVFHEARISHIYATTELGVCFAVHDGQAGLPLSWIENAAAPCELRIADDGELLVRRGADWAATGDLVEVRSDRVLFAGRKSDAIHVGGSKVQPAIVEEVIRAVPFVDAVRVYGVGSSLAGQLVAAQVQPRGGIDEETLRREILAACRAQLPKHMVPALVDFEPVTVTAAGKLQRQPG